MHGTFGAAILAGSSVTSTVTAGTGTLIQITRVLPPLFASTSPTGCTLTFAATLPAPPAFGSSATVTFNCPLGQSIPAGTVLTLNVAVSLVPPATLPSAPSMTTTVNATTTSTRPVLKSTAGTVFHITAVGSAALYVTIFGLTVGNATKLGGTAALILDNDSYTEIAKNVIGAQDLPNAIGILLSSSDHSIIHDNTIQGSTLFPRTATIALGQPSGGFGVVTAECLGSINHSNGVQLVNNLFAKNSNAGGWFCSDGTGGFFVSQNTMRANGRGIVLLDAVDTFISGNTIGDNIIDGIDVLQTSERNIITSNVIESQQAPNSAGIMLAGNGAFSPLGNQIAQNQIRRNTVDVLTAGAQGTRITNNSITTVGSNTGVLFALAIPGWTSGQPTNTSFSGNALPASGICSATAGCAIRLTERVTVPIDAITGGGNDFGLLDPELIQAESRDSGDHEHGRDDHQLQVQLRRQLPERHRHSRREGRVGGCERDPRLSGASIHQPPPPGLATAGTAVKVTLTAAPLITGPGQPITFTYTVATQVNPALSHSYTIAASNGGPTPQTVIINFGDGTAPQALIPPKKTVSHTYTSPGAYTVTLAATDNLGNIGQGMAYVTITTPVQQPPGNVDFTTPSTGDTATPITLIVSNATTVATCNSIQGYTFNFGENLWRECRERGPLACPGLPMQNSHGRIGACWRPDRLVHRRESARGPGPPKADWRADAVRLRRTPWLGCGTGGTPALPGTISRALRPFSQRSTLALSLEGRSQNGGGVGRGAAPARWLGGVPQICFLPPGRGTKPREERWTFP